MNTFLEYVFYFFFYSFFGWVGETVYCSVGEKKFVNRGFLTGPMCPIYGTGATVLNICLMPFYENFGYSKWYIILLVILLGMILADIVEFLTSLIMEKLFNARWWDYSNQKFNIQGRICLRHTCYWGIATGLFIYVIHPNVTKWVDSLITPEQRNKILVLILIVFAIDLVFAFKAAFDIRKFMKKLNKLHSDVRGQIEKSGKKLAVLTADISKQIAELENTVKAKFNPQKKIRSKVHRIVITQKSIKEDIRSKAEFIKSMIEEFTDEDKE